MLWPQIIWQMLSGRLGESHIFLQARLFASQNVFLILRAHFCSAPNPCHFSVLQPLLAVTTRYCITDVPFCPGLHLISYCLSMKVASSPTILWLAVLPSPCPMQSVPGPSLPHKTLKGTETEQRSGSSGQEVPEVTRCIASCVSLCHLWKMPSVTTPAQCAPWA